MHEASKFGSLDAPLSLPAAVGALVAGYAWTVLSSV